MIGLFFTEVSLFLVAALVGCAGGWYLYRVAGASRRSDAQRDVDALRSAWSDAQARRARNP